MTDSIEIAGESIVVRAPAITDIPALARLAAAVPPHDLLFLARDIRQPKVLDAWLRAEASGATASLVAIAGGEVVATIARVSDSQSFSAHVAELRLLVAPGHRNKGLGRRLLDQAIADACAAGATKVVARMTPDQVGAITLFEESGFRAEALLRSEVRDADGVDHDLAVLALNPEREIAIHGAFGL